MQQRPRLAVLGLDGLPLALARTLAASGRLPNLAALCQSPLAREIDAELPELSPVNWTSFATAAGPGRHGIFGFTEIDPADYTLSMIDATAVACPTIFDRLGAAGLTSKVVNLPAAYPARPLRGAMIAGFVAPDLARAVYPPELARLLAGTGYLPEADTTRGAADPDHLLGQLRATLKSRETALDILSAGGDFDLFVLVLTETDRILHFFYPALADASHPLHGPFLDLLAVWDRLIGKFLDMYHGLPEPRRLMVLADHGFAALRTEVDPRRQTPYFPEAICSRMATGYPLMFNHLRVGDLARIAEAELRRVAGLLEQSHGQHYEFDSEIPLALVMREGAATDARTVRARAEAFLKEEVYGVCRLFGDERLDESVAAIREVAVELDRRNAGEAAAAVFGEAGTARVLFAGGQISGKLYAEALAGKVEWRTASTADQVLDLLARETVDLVLLDLTMGAAEADAETGSATLAAFDYAPGAARRFAEGQKVLERLRARMPQIPVYLFDPAGQTGGTDRELLMACMRAGGARGVVETTLAAPPGCDPLLQRDLFVGEIEELARRLRQERTAAELGARSQVLAFDTAPALEGPRLRIRCRNLRLTRAVRGADAGALVSDIERPTALFADVIGGGA
ncbi:MAG: hypothetical protein GYA47_09265, partial [Desulfovibrio sp.]|nr:hypothetical protein [Desulfovibrio sp.]